MESRITANGLPNELTVNGVRCEVHQSDKRDMCVVALHGRGGMAMSMLQWVAQYVDGASIIAPQAPDNTWYPLPFTVPTEQNSSELPSSLELVCEVVETLRKQGYAYEEICLVGFSQGACLAAEFVRQYPRRYAGLVCMSGGLIGSDEEVGAADVNGSLAQMPIYIGCDAVDPHIPIERVEITAEKFANADAVVTKKIYTDYGHQPHPDAVKYLLTLLPNL